MLFRSKAAAIGDGVVINVAGYGFFATGRIASPTEPKTDWKNRYGAALNSIRLIEPPISLAVVQRYIPDLKWARYPRSIATPSPELAEQVRALVGNRRRIGTPDPDDVDLALNIEELRRVALLSTPRSATPKLKKAIYRVRSNAIRRYVFLRAKGRCEGCKSPAPFRRDDGSPFLEAHHTKRLADDGPDHPSKVIGLCPNCHRRAHYGKDNKLFNASLIDRLSKELEPVSAKA